MGTMFREPSFVKACSKATNPSPGWSSQIVGVKAHRNLRCSWICSATSSWGQCHQLMCWPGGITTQPCSMKETIIFCSGAAHGAFLGSLEDTLHVSSIFQPWENIHLWVVGWGTEFCLPWARKLHSGAWLIYKYKQKGCVWGRRSCY